MPSAAGDYFELELQKWSISVTYLYNERVAVISSQKKIHLSLFQLHDCFQ